MSKKFLILEINKMRLTVFSHSFESLKVINEKNCFQLKEMENLRERAARAENDVKVLKQELHSSKTMASQHIAEVFLLIKIKWM